MSDSIDRLLGLVAQRAGTPSSPNHDPELLSALNETTSALEEQTVRVVAMRANSSRWLALRAMVSGQHDTHGQQFFGFPSRLGLPPVGNIMRGSVAQHLDAAIDAVRLSKSIE